MGIGGEAPLAAFNTKILRAIIVLTVRAPAKSKQTLWRFRLLRGVCREFRDVLDGILMEKEAGGDIIAAAIQCRLHLSIWMHHRGCTWGYTIDLHECLLKIAAEAETTDELCERLINITFESPPVPALKRMLVSVVAGVAYTPEHRKRLRELEYDGDFAPLDVELLDMATARKLVRKAAASIMETAGRRGRARLSRESAESTRILVDSVIDYLDPSDPNMSIIAWAGLHDRFGAILNRDPKREIIPDRLRRLCIRWLLAASIEGPPSLIAAAVCAAPFGAALKFLMAVDLSRPLQDATALCATDTALGATDTALGAADTALAIMMATVQDVYRYAACPVWRPKQPRLTSIMLEFWTRFDINSLPPILAYAISQRMCVRVHQDSYFCCSSPDCGYWCLT
jgi:hypothetical protein